MFKLESKIWSNCVYDISKDLQPDVTLPDAASALAGLDNVSLIYVVFGVLFVFYLFICFYIWLNERRKRRRLTEEFQQGKDKSRYK